MRFLTLSVMAALLGLSIPAASAQTEAPADPSAPHLVARYAVRPGNHLPEALRAQTASGATIPLWTSNITDGAVTYTYTMVGKNPMVTQATPVTSVPTVLYPVKFIFKTSGGTTIATQDPTVADTKCSPKGIPLTLVKNSPFFNNITNFKIGSTVVGTGQFTSLFQRANFWKYTGKAGGKNPNYQVNLAMTVGKTITVTETGGNSGIYPATVPCGGKLTYLDINAWDSYVQNTLMPQLKVKPTMLPIFLFYNTVMIEGSSLGSCCILGYHGSTPSATLQTYSIIDYDTTGLFKVQSSNALAVEDTSVMSHELAEWRDDPDGSNPTAPWGNIGQVSGCQNNLEVGDPLSGNPLRVIQTVGGFNYHAQDLAFFSWFYHQKPSIGILSTYYSLYGLFKTSAAAC